MPPCAASPAVAALGVRQNNMRLALQIFVSVFTFLFITIIGGFCYTAAFAQICYTYEIFRNHNSICFWINFVFSFIFSGYLGYLSACKALQLERKRQTKQKTEPPPTTSEPKTRLPERPNVEIKRGKYDY